MTPSVHRHLVPLQKGIAAWPGSPGFRVFAPSRLPTATEANATRARRWTYTSGTHVDAPAHFIQGGATLDAVGLDPFVGPAYVAAIVDNATRSIDARRSTRRRSRTARSACCCGRATRATTAVPRRPFREDYAALTAEAARLGRRPTGSRSSASTTSRSSASTTRPTPTGSSSVRASRILEGLDLAPSSPGQLPAHLPARTPRGVEAAPARAVLLTGDGGVTRRASSRSCRCATRASACAARTTGRSAACRSSTTSSARCSSARTSTGSSSTPTPHDRRRRRPRRSRTCASSGAPSTSSAATCR